MTKTFAVLSVLALLASSTYAGPVGIDLFLPRGKFPCPRVTSLLPTLSAMATMRLPFQLTLYTEGDISTEDTAATVDIAPTELTIVHQFIQSGAKANPTLLYEHHP
ncbi:uncharacterized protein LOC117187936 isoform X1 [Drosophila miranda]|uniref:uncharacterized protein LOC117187936 isoform X1 n=1 Tax=Drosophila miranda TaxID=7229 RepID=UPI00143FB840|nr:uncharacterized protein LOC117187936 isoform X1 [Drosophila miranda]